MANETIAWSHFKTNVQVDLVDGYGYLDHTGDVLKEYASLYEDVGVGLNGARLQDPKTPGIPDAVQFSIQNINLGYSDLEPLSGVIKDSPKWFTTISRLIGTTQFKRIGLRAAYFIPEDATRVIRAFAHRALPSYAGDLVAESQNWPTFNIVFNHQQRRFGVRTEIGAFRVTPSPQQALNWYDFPENGMKLDIDVSEPADRDDQETARFGFGHLSESLEGCKSIIDDVLLRYAAQLLPTKEA